MKKCALITGASSGFGYSLIEPLVLAGFDVIATCRKASERLHLFADLQKKYPGRVFVQELDVASRDDREAIAKYLTQNHDGQLDCLINNAGFGVFGALEHDCRAQSRCFSGELASAFC